MDNEFRRYAIPQKWRKWIWIGTISGLIYLAKRLDIEKTRLEKELRDCNRGRITDAETKRKADSTLIYRIMDEAFKKSNEKIIQPALDSARNAQL